MNDLAARLWTARKNGGVLATQHNATLQGLAIIGEVVSTIAIGVDNTGSVEQMVFPNRRTQMVLFDSSGFSIVSHALIDHLIEPPCVIPIPFLRQPRDMLHNLFIAQRDILFKPNILFAVNLRIA